MLRSQLIEGLAEAFRAESDRPLEEIAVEWVQAQGMRRATWATLARRQQQGIINHARYRVKSPLAQQEQIDAQALYDQLRDRIRNDTDIEAWDALRSRYPQYEAAYVAKHGEGF